MSTASDSSADLTPLGVGVTWTGGLHPLLVRRPELVDVVEFEPQTTWLGRGARAGTEEAAVLERLRELPARKLVHSITAPVGGGVAAHPDDLRRLHATVEQLEAPWVSEHLSFQQSHERAAGFFLPPRQTRAGVAVAVAAIERLRAALGVPIAVETGVNYLRPRPDELADAEFTAAVIQGADCGLLLDLHNVYANARNGRQPLDEFLAGLPLDRVWELHFAGGFELDGYWLDAHSGAVPEPVLAVAERLIPTLSHLRAIVFEIYPSFIPLFGLDRVAVELERLRALWALRPRAVPPAPPPARPIEVVDVRNDALQPEGWERALAHLVTGGTPRDDDEQELAGDPAVPLVGKLVREFRASMIVETLPLTSKYLMLTLGTKAFETLLTHHFATSAPEMFGVCEAETFGARLNADLRAVPRLAPLLAYELACLRTIADGQARTVPFTFEPLPFLRALADNRLPDDAGPSGRFEIEVTANDVG